MIKVNDGVFYASGMEYFNSLIIHNLLFPSSLFILTGFIENKNKDVCIELQQPLIEGGHVDLEITREVLTFNGFVNVKW